MSLDLLPCLAHLSPKRTIQVLNRWDGVTLQMLRLSKLADYAVVTMVELGRHRELMNAPALAQATGLPEPTVAKLLKILLADGLLMSRRGARGGYELALPLEKISVARVITAVDGPVAVTACVSGGDCTTAVDCALRGSWNPVNAAIRQTLENISLAEMAHHNERFCSDLPDGAGCHAGAGLADYPASGG